MNRRRGRRTPKQGDQALPDTSAVGGTWKPLTAEQTKRIADAAIGILCEIGVSEASGLLIDTITGCGGRFDGDRLRYGREWVETVLRDAPRRVALCGQDSKHDLVVGDSGSYPGTGGAAPLVLDLETGRYRRSTLADLYGAARLADALPHIRFFSRSLVAGDIEDPRELDLNTAFASLAGTAKHVMVQATRPEHVAPIAHMCHRVAGSEASFRERPFLSLNVNHAVPPLRFHADSAGVIAEAVRHGIPVHCNVFGQLGASSPVTLAGSAAQTLAEVLAGVAFVHGLDPGAACNAGPRPMITDLRTGGMAGGAGEQAMATAMCLQVLRAWNLPCSAIAGATDSKLPDAQAGYEKALQVNTAIQAGANLVTQAAGMQAGLMGVSFAALVIDNEMLGAIQRANVLPDIFDETLALDAIAEVVVGEGHFLGRPETYARMKSDFLYPEIADRRTVEEWEADGAKAMAERAGERARELLATHFPSHVKPELRSELRSRFGLRLDAHQMEAS